MNCVRFLLKFLLIYNVLVYFHKPSQLQYLVTVFAVNANIIDDGDTMGISCCLHCCHLSPGAVHQLQYLITLTPVVSIIPSYKQTLYSQITILLHSPVIKTLLSRVTPLNPYNGLGSDVV